MILVAVIYLAAGLLLGLGFAIALSGLLKEID